MQKSTPSSSLPTSTSTSVSTRSSKPKSSHDIDIINPEKFRNFLKSYIKQNNTTKAPSSSTPSKIIPPSSTKMNKKQQLPLTSLKSTRLQPRSVLHPM